MSDPEDDKSSNPESSSDGAGAPAFTIVGLGASAGGVEAVSELLRTLPEDTGMGFVLVQHLDPRHESILASLLANRTPMPVTQVHEDTPVQPNHLYVIPPNNSMVISKRVLSLNPRTGKEPHRPIDTFFMSLADDMGPTSIGVILSGTASDGTLGLKAIKSAGGITFCQDLTAKFDSMPRSAIAAGVVDFVLAPEQIASELVSIARHPYYNGQQQFRRTQDEAALQNILRLLRSRTTVDFAQYKQPTIQRRLMRRMALRKVDTLEEYRGLLEQDPPELEALFDDLLINVTEFFRDPEVFQTIKRIVIPAILKEHKPGETLRIWVPGCSSGEEVYSLAIAFLEFLEENQMDFPLRLFGTDVSERIIESARAGLYPESIMATISTERLRRFFVRMDSGYQISRGIREMCIFSRHNIAKDPPLSRMDLISCRNLLIYFNTPLQKRVVATFSYALLPTGCLVLGSSETLGSFLDYFVMMDPKHKIFCLKPNVQRPTFELQTGLGADDVYVPSFAAPTRQPERGDPHTVHRYIDQMLLAQAGPSALILNREWKAIEFRGQVTRYLRLPPDETSMDALTLVREGLVSHLKQALEEARRQGTTVRTEAIQLTDGSRPEQVTVTVVPVRIPGDDQYLAVLFEEDGRRQEKEAGEPRPKVLEPERHIEQLEMELNSTRQYLQAIIEELRSSNEEAQSTNEELQSTNEELQTAKEEMQSSNEELHTINEEMQSRNLELAQVNDDLNNLLSSMNMPVIMMGNDLRIRRFTPTAETVLHLIPTDVGRPISDLQPRINVTDLERILRGVLETLAPFEREVQDQEGRWYLLRVRPYRTADNRIEGAVLQLLDVGELKRTLEDVRHARDYAQTIVDTVREPLAVLDDSLALQDANRSFFNYFTLSRKDMIGKRGPEMTRGPLANPNLLAQLATVVDRGAQIHDLEIDYELAGLGRRILAVTARRMPAERPLILVAFEDITDRKLAEEARYRRLFEHSKDGIVIVDAATGEIVDINPYIEQLFGRKRTETVAMKFWEVPPLRDLPHAASALDRIRQQGMARFADVTATTKEGRALQFEIIANVYPEGDRSVIQFNLRDLTERRNFDRELQHTARLESLGMMAGGIAHDFNNLLTGILGNASLMYSSTAVGERNRSYLSDIMRASEQAGRLTQQMLAYAGKGRYVTERLRVAELIQDAAALIRTSIPPSVELRIHDGDDTSEIEGDPGQLRQLLMNLVVNGAEAIGENRPGRVEIRTSGLTLSREETAERFAGDDLAPGRYVAIEVSDTGEGMDEATRARIFEPFFSTKFTGRGLGLAAALGIVRSHGGAVRAYSTPAQGSLFRVLLPEAPTETADVRPPASAARRGHGKILLSEDDAAVRNVTKEALERAGFTVITADNGREAVNALRTRADEVRLVVLDILMPAAGGENTLKEIRAIRGDVPVVVISGLDRAEAVRRFGKDGFAAFLQKPYSHTRLVDAVTGVLDGRR